MRFALFALSLVALPACAMLPTPDTGEVSYTAMPTANPNAPTTRVNHTITITNPVTPITMPAQQGQPVLSSPVVAAAPATLPTLGAHQVNPVVNVFIVRQDAMGESLVPVNVGTPVKSGDILEYQGLFTNQGADRVRSMEVTLSIADGLELVGGVSPQFAQASIDGSRFVRMPIRANIGGVIQELPLSQYKALRWTVEDLGLNGTAVVKYRARVK